MAAKALRVLLVDADPEYLAANRQRLESDGHEVHTASDGASALELAAGWASDLVVLGCVPSTSKWTDNTIIPLKERMDDVYFDPLRSVIRRLGGGNRKRS